MDLVLSRAPGIRALPVRSAGSAGLIVSLIVLTECEACQGQDLKPPLKPACKHAVRGWDFTGWGHESWLRALTDDTPHLAECFACRKAAENSPDKNCKMGQWVQSD